MDKLIPVTNQIQDAVASVQLDLGLELPQIAVVGGQSVGKSSLLESLVGHAFLPTGSGVVTRRPLVLRLCNTRRGNNSSPDAEWGEFGHLPGTRFEDFGAIRREIEQDTMRVCGQQQSVSPEPIVLQISSPNVLDLTLIDLPGMTRVPVGDQPEDIERQIRELVLSYVSKPSCLILAVVAGNQDLATADALAVARRVDPEGVRTIGVVTKLDLVEHGVADAAVLEGRVYPLRLGFVGVVCRSSRDVQAKKHLKEHLDSEMEFFRNHSVYRSLAQRCGIAYLAKHLNHILMDHICEALPGIRNQVMQLVHQYEVELQGYGESISVRRGDQGAFLLGLLTKFAGRFGDAIEGKLTGQQEIPGQLVGRARIDFIFRDVFARTLRDFDCCGGLSDDEIRVAIRNATGPRATLFVPEAAFELLVRKQISKLQVPSLQCADLVHEELQRVLILSELPEFRRFVNLREQIFGVVRGIMTKCFEPTVQMIKDLVAIELAYINTNHPDFVGSSGAMRAALAPREPGKAAGEQRRDVVALRAIPEKSGSPMSPAPADGQSGGGGGFFSFFRQQGRGRASSPPEAAEVAPRVAGAGGFSRSTGALPVARPATGDAESDRFAASKGGATNAFTPQVRPAFGPGDGAFGFGTGGGGNSCNAGALRLPHIPPVLSPATTAPTQRERVEVSIIKMLMESYFALVKKNVADSVPKAVMHFMVNKLKDVIQSECVARLYKEERFEELLREARDVQGRRARCQDRLKALYKVIEVIGQIRDGADAW